MVTEFDRCFSPAGENRGIHLYLPDEYYDTLVRYPVIYMFDGHNLYFDSEATFGTHTGIGLDHHRVAIPPDHPPDGVKHANGWGMAIFYAGL